MVYNKSPQNSFEGWKLFEFIKGRKKTLITLVATGLGYFVSSDVNIALIAGGLVEGALAIAEFYLKKIEL